MRVFILEDDESRMDIFLNLLKEDEVTRIKSCTEADKFKPPYDLIFLDHDLGGRQLQEHEDCGLTFVKLIRDQLLEGYAQGVNSVVIHSYNPDGVKAMRDCLNEVHMTAYPFPFGGREFYEAINIVRRATRREAQ